MQWIPDPSTGAWLRDRLDDPWNASMHSVVPHGYEAYVRILHPGVVQSLPDRPVPSDDEWRRMSTEESMRLAASLQAETVTWARTAEAFGTTLHPLAQWQRLVRTPVDADWRSRIAPDGREFIAPIEGELHPDTVAAIAAHLMAHTTTPDAGVAAIWAGFGGLLGHYGHTASRAFLTFDDDPQHQAMLDRSTHDPFNTVFRKPTWQEGILSREISEGPRLELLDRAYVLFSASAREFASPDWLRAAPWRDVPAEERGLPLTAHSPNILWPADRAWVLVSEIDYDSTVIAGPAALIARICADPALEALPLREGAELHWDADDVNR